ncbi:MAG: apolipoprotein N-acyltransferase [Gammaproteobacteria bacterium]
MKKWLTKPYLIDLLALLAGLLTVTAFAPFEWFLIAIISPAVLLFCWLNVSAKRAFWRGWLFGIGMFGGGVSWVFISIHVYGNTAPPLAFLITLLFIAALSLYPACQGWLLKRLFPQDSTAKLLLAFPASWVLFEWIRTWLFTGFPWLLLGYSQTDSHLQSLAPLFGAFGISFIVTFSSALIVCFIRSFYRKQKQAYTYLLVFIVLHAIPTPLNLVQWTQTKGQPIQVSLVQGNIPQQLKWSQDYIDTTLEKYAKLTQPHWNSQIIVWPEAAIPLPLHAAQSFVDLLDEKAKENGAVFITGLPIKAEDSDQYYNSVLALGQDQGRYDKRYLVPFGEYVPFDKVLRGLINFFDLPMSDFIRGSAKQVEISAANISIGAFICYEIAYSGAMHSLLPQAELLITVSNDAWFGDSLAPEQHLQIAQFRSLQSGRYQLFSTNDGITAIISPQGKVIAQLPQFTSGVLTGEVQAMTGATPWVYVGGKPAVGLMFLLLIIALLISKISNRRRRPDLKSPEA